MILYFLLLLSVVKNCACFFNAPMNLAPSCSYISISIYPKDPLPSQEIRVGAVCTSLGRTPTPCPTCTVENAYLHETNHINDRERCRTNFQIRVNSERYQTDVRITCRTRHQSSTKKIVVEKSKNNGRCCDSVDCMYSSQECIVGVCVCPRSTFFIEAKQRCYQTITNISRFCEVDDQCERFAPVISNISQFCEVDDQCERFAPGMMCKLGVCSCAPDFRLQISPSPHCILKGTDSQECQNLTISISNRFPIFSDVVSVVSSCTSDTKKNVQDRQYPALDFISPDVEIIPVRNVSYYIGPKCFSHVDFTFGNKNRNHTSLSRDLRVTMRFRIPKVETNESLYVHTNNYIESCRQDRDCNGLLQCDSYTCLCPDGYAFVPKAGHCLPSVSRLYGACAYSEQCSFRGSICRQGSCQCQPEFWLDTNSGSCVQEGRSLGETCELDRHCKLEDVHSICSTQLCTCNIGWEERDGTCALISNSGTASRHQIGYLNTIAMIIFSLIFWNLKTK